MYILFYLELKPTAPVLLGLVLERDIVMDRT